MSENTTPETTTEKIDSAVEEISAKEAEDVSGGFRNARAEAGGIAHVLRSGGGIPPVEVPRGIVLPKPL